MAVDYQDLQDGGFIPDATAAETAGTAAVACFDTLFGETEGLDEAVLNTFINHPELQAAIAACVADSMQITITKTDLAEAIQDVDVDGDGDVGTVDVEFIVDVQPPSAPVCAEINISDTLTNNTSGSTALAIVNTDGTYTHTSGTGTGLNDWTPGPANTIPGVTLTMSPTSDINGDGTTGDNGIHVLVEVDEAAYTAATGKTVASIRAFFQSNTGTYIGTYDQGIYPYDANRVPDNTIRFGPFAPCV